MTEFRFGTQGWRARAWVGSFYEKTITPENMLRAYAQTLRTVEVHATFHGTPAEPVLGDWAEEVPDDFVFSLKFPQQITHERGLHQVDRECEKFLARAAVLGSKGGVFLATLGPDFQATGPNLVALREFLRARPRDHRWAVEFRHRSWLTPSVLSLLSDQNVALGLVEGRWLPTKSMIDLLDQPTADFAYVRWMECRRPPPDKSADPVTVHDPLARWTERLEALPASVKTVYGYFHDRYPGGAVKNAMRMADVFGSMAASRASS